MKEPFAKLPEIIYYLRERSNSVTGHCGAPVVTVVLQYDETHFYRGISICSVEDQPNKKIGIIKARGMATKARCQKIKLGPVTGHLRLEPISLYPHVNSTLFFMDSLAAEEAEALFKWGKSSFCTYADLTEREKHLAKKAGWVE